jgi:hypothetical protein
MTTPEERFLIDLMAARAATAQLRLMIESVRTQLGIAGESTEKAYLMDLRVLDLEKMLVDLHALAEPLLAGMTKEQGSTNAPAVAHLH